MRYLFTLILSLITFFNSFSETPEVTKKFNNELTKHFGIESLDINEIDELSKFNDLFYKVFDGEKELGLVVLTAAKGRYELFDYLIIYNLKSEIELIKILVYRSEYGSEITAKRWLKQFYKKESERLNYGSDIQAISGATFSATSITRNVNRINSIVKEYYKKE